MNALDHELKKLQEERQRIEVEMANANEKLLQTQHTLSDAGGRRNELATKVAPLQRLVNELTASGSAIETQRQAAWREIKPANEFHGQIALQIENALPKARHKAFEVAIEAVNAAIAKQESTAQSLQHKLVGAQVAVAEARKKAAEFDGLFRERLTQLHQLPGQVQQTRRQVAKLSDAAKAAAANGRMGEALYLAHELEQALDQLSQLIDPEKEAKLANELNETWRESQTAKETIAEKSSAAEQLKRDLTAADRELQRKLQEREADIKSALVAAEMAETTTARQSVEPSARQKAERRPRKADR